jgi:hypothetical protein
MNATNHDLTSLQPVASFVAGTLVHAKSGLVPIEKVRVGDFVLSQLETTGEIAFRPVARTMPHESSEVYLLEYFLSDESTARNLVVGGNHPFWVRDFGWVIANDLVPGRDLALHDGRAACVYKVRKIFNTDIPGVGWTSDDAYSEGPSVDLRADSIKVSKMWEEDEFNAEAFDFPDNFLKRRVFNIEVDGFHTYYVGESGVLVHDGNVR